MIRTVSRTLLIFLLLGGAGMTVLAQESVPVTLETAFTAWATSLPDDGTWELQMPPEKISEDLEGLTTTLLEAPEGPDMNPGLKAGYLVALADRTALEGDRGRARTLYQILGQSRIPLLEMWSVYMLAGLDFSEGHYDHAASGYDRVCSDGAISDWKDHACSMVGLAQRLDTLELEGGDHGDAGNATP